MEPATILLAVVVILLLVLLLRPPPRDRGADLLQQQLLDLRGRLDRIVSAQDRIPSAMAEGRAAQAEAIARQMETVAALVSRQLEASGTSVGQRLEETGRAVADVRERLGQLAEATRRLEAVGETVVEVQELLRVPRLRGTLGEVWLEELLRQVFPSAQYDLQYGFRSGARVDAVIRIGDRLVPVDSKFPLEACQRMLAAADDDERERERRSFRRSLRERIDEIAGKYICPDEGTFDFALMYIPAEAVYYEAVVRGEDLEDGTGVLAYAMARRVIPVSPHTFYAYLSAVLYGLKGLQVEARAREMLGALNELEQQFGRFRITFEKVGTHLANAQKQFSEGERQAMKVGERLSVMTGPGGEPPVPPVDDPPPVLEP